MSELLGLATIAPREKNDKSAPGIAMPQAAGMHAKLVKADFHGSIMTGQFGFSRVCPFDFFGDDDERNKL